MAQCNGIRAVLPIMRAQGWGHIANTASGVGFSPMACRSMYSAIKSALTRYATSFGMRTFAFQRSFSGLRLLPSGIKQAELLNPQ
ncbi:MAG: SDR family NAD(P)-dependent oxidoreductase [Chlorobium sp.]|nr:SDR family NAD(P)-dependent oxidoreductase [Chlorobium sp.]